MVAISVESYLVDFPDNGSQETATPRETNRVLCLDKRELDSVFCCPLLCISKGIIGKYENKSEVMNLLDTITERSTKSNTYCISGISVACKADSI